MFLNTATLRLFKLDSNSSSGNDWPEGAGNGGSTAGGAGSNEECGWNSAHAEELIRITVSAYVKKHRKCKYDTWVVTESLANLAELYRQEEDLQQHYGAQGVFGLDYAQCSLHDRTVGAT